MKVNKTLAAILTETSKPLVVDEIDLPDTLSCGQVLVELFYSGICGAQINEIDAVKGPDKFLPHLLGHEGTGRVIEVGPLVRTVKPGDVVVLHWRPSDGLQAETPNYTWKGRKLNAGWVTTFNRHAVVSENRLTVLPGDFDLKTATLFGCAVTTALGVVNNDAEVKIGESVVVFGVGGVGLNVVQTAAMVSANPVVGIDLFDGKLEAAKRFGASHVINSKGMEPAALREQILSIVGAAGADVVVETTGNARVIEQAYELAAKQGRVILVGVPRKGENVNIYTLPLHFRKVLKGSEGGGCRPHVDIPRLVRLCQAGRMALDGIITHEFALAQVNEALATVRSGQAGRVLLDLS